MKEKDQFLGIIKWFDQDKGFGVLTDPSGKEIFMHRNSIRDSGSNYIEGKIVVFHHFYDSNRGRESARDIYLFSNVEHWLQLNELIILQNTDPEFQSKNPLASKIFLNSLIQFSELNSSQAFVDCIKDSFEVLRKYFKLEPLIDFFEKTIYKVFRTEKASEHLQELYIYIGKKLDFDVVFDSWKDKKLKDTWSGKHREIIVKSFLDSIDSKLTEEDKFELFLKGLYPKFKESSLLERITSLSEAQIREIVKFKLLKSESGYNVFPILINHYPRLSELIVDYAKSNFSIELFDSFQESLLNTIDRQIYLGLWIIEKVKKIDRELLIHVLKDSASQYEKVRKMVSEGLVSIEHFNQALKENIKDNLDPKNRREFKTLENSLLELIEIDSEFNFEEIDGPKKYLNLILWAYSIQDRFEFDGLREKFIYFEPEKQIELIKKLFYLKATGQFDLQIDHLTSLNRFDLDLYLENQKEHPQIPIDISTDLIINLLDSYSKSGDFFVESKLFEMVLKDLLIDKTFRFKMDGYFEKCKGRTDSSINWKDVNGSVEKVPYKDKFFFKIVIQYYFEKWNGEQTKNPSAKLIADQIKNIPGSKYNYEYGYWGVPGKYEEMVFEIMQNHKLEAIGTEDRYKENRHLAKKRLSSIPNGITYCEGREANSLDNIFGEKFWWCQGLPCLEHCEGNYSSDEWKKFSLLDFMRILNLNVDETSRNGEVIPNGKYYRFLSTINRFNELLKKVYCKDCNHILFPVESGNFGVRNVTRFHCKNEDCNNEEIIYLIHCLNGKCNNIVDSRESKSCPNGLYICDKCGCCCSHSQMSRRLDNLKLTGGTVGQSLVNFLDRKLGHLERRVFFCYKCGGNMEENVANRNVLNCSTCAIEYDLKSYHFKFPHIGLPKEPTDFAKPSLPPNNSNNIDDVDLPF